MANLTLDSRDTVYTIDSYGTFSLDDNEVEDPKDETGNTYLEYGKDYEYNGEGYIKALADQSVTLLNNNLVFKGSIIKSVKLDKTKSPQFYNYTTDSYTADYEFDQAALDRFMADVTPEQWSEFLANEWANSYDLNPSEPEFNQDSLTTAQLDYYTRSIYSYDDYIMDMWECQREIADENVIYLGADGKPLRETKYSVHVLDDKLAISEYAMFDDLAAAEADYNEKLAKPHNTICLHKLDVIGGQISDDETCLKTHGHAQ